VTEWIMAIVFLIAGLAVIAIIFAVDRNLSNSTSRQRIVPIMFLIIGLVLFVCFLGIVQLYGNELTGVAWDFFRGEQ